MFKRKKTEKPTEETTEDTKQQDTLGPLRDVELVMAGIEAGIEVGRIAQSLQTAALLDRYDAKLTRAGRRVAALRNVVVAQAAVNAAVADVLAD